MSILIGLNLKRSNEPYLVRIYLDANQNFSLDTGEFYATWYITYNGGNPFVNPLLSA